MELTRDTLPLEILNEILHKLALPEVTKFLWTSRAFNQIATGIVYRDLALSGEGKVQRCFETLAFNEDAARHVKSLLIQNTQSMEGTSMFNRTLRAAFKNISASLESLNVTGCGLDLIPILRRLRFPLLKSFHTSEDLCPVFVQFLQAHTKLESLSIGELLELPGPNRPVRGCHTEMRVKLPSLCRFGGPHAALPIFLPGSQVIEAVVHCNYPHWQLIRIEEKVVNALAMSGIPLKRLTFTEFPYHSTIFHFIGKKLTHLTTISFSSIPIDHVADGGLVLTGLKSILPLLPALYRLDFTTVEPSINTVKFMRLEGDHMQLLRLTTLRDTLAIVRTPSGVLWGRLKNSGHWIPLLTDNAGLRWWLAKSWLLSPLQSRVFRVITSPILSGQPRTKELSDAEQTKRDKATLHSVRRVTTHVINKAYGVGSSIAPPQARSKTSQCPLGYIPEEEKLHIIVRGTRGQLLEPYVDTEPGTSDPPYYIWSHFIALLGHTPLYSMTGRLSIPGFNSLMTKAFDDKDIPILDDTRREVFGFIVDLLWNSLHAASIDVKQYLRNPEDEWKDATLHLPVLSLAAEFPARM